MAPLNLSIHVEHWPIAGAFTISRGTKTEVVVVVAELSDGAHRGRGECVPYARYGETVESVRDALERRAGDIADGLDRDRLQEVMPPSAARSALDCALWDLAAKRAGRRVHELAGLPAPNPLTTAYTVSLASPDAMARASAAAADRPLLKIKLGGADDAARIAAVREAAPKSRLIVDANEGWNADNVERNFAACAEAGVSLIEQPLARDRDELLRTLPRPVPVCADESAHSRRSLPALLGKYDAVNIKLDKAGGFTEALAMLADSERFGFTIMVGCMVSTSLSLAPAMLLAQRARVVDLDGALVLARDREYGLRYQGSVVHPPAAELWG